MLPLFPDDGGGVIAGREDLQNGGFLGVRRCDAGGRDRRLLGVRPVVVRLQEDAVGVRNSSIGSARKLPTPAEASDGPRPRMSTFDESPVPTMKPPIRTWSAVWTLPRVLMFASCAELAGSRS